MIKKCHLFIPFVSSRWNRISVCVCWRQRAGGQPHSLNSASAKGTKQGERGLLGNAPVKQDLATSVTRQWESRDSWKINQQLCEATKKQTANEVERMCSFINTELIILSSNLPPIQRIRIQKCVPIITLLSPPVRSSVGTQVLYYTVKQAEARQEEPWKPEG